MIAAGLIDWRTQWAMVRQAARRVVESRGMTFVRACPPTTGLWLYVEVDEGRTINVPEDQIRRHMPAGWYGPAFS